jgi:hypothetical protein
MNMAPRKEVRKSSLERLSEEFGELLLACADSISSKLKAAGQADDVEIVAILTEGLKVQTAAFAPAMRQVDRLIDDGERQLVETFLQRSGGFALIRRSRASLAEGGVLSTARIAGLADIIELIKKIISLILGNFKNLGALGQWIDKIFKILNNLIHALFGRLGREAEEVASRAMNRMYNHLQQIYRTEAALMALQDRRRLDDKGAEN